MEFRIERSFPEPALEQKWHEFLPDSTYPSHYTSPGFFRMPYWEGQNPFAVLVVDKDRVVAAVCGVNIHNHLNSGIEVRPQVSISQHVDQDRAVKTLVDGLTAAGGSNCELITLHSATRIDAFTDLGFRMKRAKGSFKVVMLDLSEGSEEIFKGFSQSRRSDIRKAIRQEKIQISQVETLEELSELHAIHVAWCKSKKVEPDDWKVFRAAWEQKEYKRTFIAKTEGKIIAGSYFRFYKNSLVEYAANNSIPEYRNLRPNDLLVWRAIEWSCENGFKRFSMGGSHLFLKRFGGRTVASYRYQRDLTTFQRHAAKDALYRLAIKGYQRLPDSARTKIKRVFKK